jgi:DNA sulfur modification protein DndC
MRSLRSFAAVPFGTRHSTLDTSACPIQIDTSTPSCGHSRFGCWTCTVVERDKASEGLLAAGDERMEKLIEFRETGLGDLIWN